MCNIMWYTAQKYGKCAILYRFALVHFSFFFLCGLQKLLYLCIRNKKGNKQRRAGSLNKSQGHGQKKMDKFEKVVIHLAMDGSMLYLLYMVGEYLVRHM